MSAAPADLRGGTAEVLAALGEALDARDPRPELREAGTLTRVGEGIALVDGLPGCRADELLRFPRGVRGLAFNLDPGRIGAILLDDHAGLRAGDRVRRSGAVLDVPVGEGLLGRTVDALLRPLDGGGPVHADERSPVEREAPAIMDRAPVTVPLVTGIKAVDAMVPIGRGQRELILGDRQTGKTAIAVDTILNQRGEGVRCVYCAIGKRSAAVAKVAADLRRGDALPYTALVVTTEEDPPGQRYVAPFAAMAVAEWFRDRGHDALVVLDDLTRHARAYRELSLLLRRPPGREAYPGDIFYLHSRLLERSTHLRDELGGGSLTALPIIETEAQDISAYIPTNLISITDGQIYLSPERFQKGELPAIEIGRSVSRVGGKTQLPAYRGIAADLRLSYAQFEELESFSRFGTRLDDETRRRLHRGRLVREVLKQDQYDPMTVPQQIAALFAVGDGLLDDLEPEAVRPLERRLRRRVEDRLSDWGERVLAGEESTEADLDALRELVDELVDEDPETG